MDILSDIRCFGGRQIRFKHDAESTRCTMHGAIYLPPQAENNTPVPVLYWLSGLTCNDENFVTKAGAQRYAAEQGVAVVAPDTSPRGEEVPDDDNQAYDFGLGAGFYLSATRDPWCTHYHMDKYTAEELPALLNDRFPIDAQRQSIFGHSMGGHGALTIALKNPHRYRSVSAFAPICAPSDCPWGVKAFTNYLGADKQTWAEYDTCALVRQATDKKFTLFIDQGTADNFLTEQLMPERLEAACAAANYPLILRRQEGYDHSYFFIASFIGEHIKFHCEEMSR